MCIRDRISAAAHTPEIGVVIDEALTAIERENERLKGIPVSYTHLDKYLLNDRDSETQFNREKE